MSHTSAKKYEMALANNKCSLRGDPYGFIERSSPIEASSIVTNVRATGSLNVLSTDSMLRYANISNSEHLATSSVHAL